MFTSFLSRNEALSKGVIPMDYKFFKAWSIQRRGTAGDEYFVGVADDGTETPGINCSLGDMHGYLFVLYHAVRLDQ